MSKSSRQSQVSKDNTDNKGSKQAIINIIFDLDATLISSNNIPTNYGSPEPDWKTMTIGPHNMAIIQGSKTESGQENNLMLYRPYAAELINYLRRQKNVAISVWSAGEQKYVEGICQVLFGVDWRKTLKIVISRKDSTPKYTSIISQTGEVFDSDFENRSIKDLAVLFTHPKWGKIFTPKNTLLIDDAHEHYVMNKGRNIVHVPGWDGVNSCDTVLWQLQQWLRPLITKPPSDLSRVPEFETTSHLGMTSGYTRSLYNPFTKNLKTIEKNNRICGQKLINYYQCMAKMKKPNMTPEDEDIRTDRCTQDYLIDMKKWRASDFKTVKKLVPKSKPKSGTKKTAHVKRN